MEAQSLDAVQGVLAMIALKQGIEQLEKEAKARAAGKAILEKLGARRSLAATINSGSDPDTAVNTAYGELHPNRRLAAKKLMVKKKPAVKAASWAGELASGMREQRQQKERREAKRQETDKTKAAA